MTTLLSPTPTVAACDDGGHPLAQPAEGMDRRDLMPSLYGHSAELVATRHLLGLEQADMAKVLGGVRLSTYQRWENGRDAIPDGILFTTIPDLLARFQKTVDDLVAEVPDGDDEYEVKVWRGQSEGRPFPGWWMRIVATARMREPRITPRFPEDVGDAETIADAEERRRLAAEEAAARRRREGQDV